MTRECVTESTAQTLIITNYSRQPLVTRDTSKFVVIFMMYFDITEREKDRFDTGMC